MLGPVFLDIQGLMPAPREHELLQSSLVGGVILFSRNFQGKAQLKDCVSAIRSHRPEILVAVDHEGGRVQRFREGMTVIPPMNQIGRIYDQNPDRGLLVAESLGRVMLWELKQLGVDFSFAPVLDLEYGRSSVMHSRCLHHDPEIVAQLAAALCRGIRLAGSVAVGKHFPGHGYAEADSHIALPRDERGLEEINQCDLVSFVKMIGQGLEGVMPSHVLYPQIDDYPAGFSKVWLQRELRQRLRFKGVIFSDDLTMGGALVVGDLLQRARRALSAGCDMVLVCNSYYSAKNLVDGLKDDVSNASSLERIEKFRQQAQRDPQMTVNEYERSLEDLNHWGVL